MRIKTNDCCAYYCTDYDTYLHSKPDIIDMQHYAMLGRSSHSYIFGMCSGGILLPDAYFLQNRARRN
jgi:hypothetical protein